MNISLKNLVRISLILVVTVLMFSCSLIRASAAKITISPASVTLPENGGSQVVSLSLDNPIIANSGSQNLTVTLTSSDPNVTVSPSSVTFLHDQWFLPQSFTITTGDVGVANPYHVVTIGLSSSSGSEYYNGYTSSIAVTLIDGDRTAPMLTELVPIPDQVTSSSATYHFSTSGDITNYEILTDCPDGTVFNITDGTVSFNNLVIGQSYGDCNVALHLNAYPSSNVLHINSFTAIAPPQISVGYISGGSPDITWTPQTGFVYHTKTSSAAPATYHSTRILKKIVKDSHLKKRRHHVKGCDLICNKKLHK